MRIPQSKLVNVWPECSWVVHLLGYTVTMELYRLDGKYYINIIKTKDKVTDKQCYEIDHLQYFKYFCDYLDQKNPDKTQYITLAKEQEQIAATCTDERLKQLHLNAAECYKNKANK